MKTVATIIMCVFLFVQIGYAQTCYEGSEPEAVQTLTQEQAVEIIFIEYEEFIQLLESVDFTDIEPDSWLCDYTGALCLRSLAFIIVGVGIILAAIFCPIYLLFC